MGVAVATALAAPGAITLAVFLALGLGLAAPYALLAAIPRLAGLLLNVTGSRWTIALSASRGEPTLAEQGAAADAARRASAADHPLVRAILEAFPGARIDAVHDGSTDAYGLPPSNEADPDMPAFAPLDAEPADEASSPWEMAP